MLLQKVGLVSEYAVRENIELCNPKDGHDAVTAGRVGLRVCCNREYKILSQNRWA